MNLRRPFLLSLFWPLALACGGGDGKTDGTSGADTTATSDTGTSDTPTSEATTDTSTSGPTSSTGMTSMTSTSAGETGTSTTGGDSTTGGELPGFERYKLTSAAGPCPPNMDCNGFIELLAPGTLRVEPFGAVGDPVTEAQISAEDFTAAVQVFAAAELVALLDAPDPLCNAPTDIFETMLVEIDGGSHDADTTFCEQAPLVAARDMANMLAMKYAP